MSNFKNILLNGFHPFFRVLATSTFLLFSFLVVLRLFEFLFLLVNGIIQLSNFWVLSKSIVYDLNACAVFFIVTFPIFLLLKLVSNNFSFKLHRVILLIFLILTIVLNYYFYINKELLGFNVFSYSFTEIYLIVSHELLALNFVFGLAALLLVVAAFYFFIYMADYTNRFKGDWLTVILIGVFGIINLVQLKYSCPVSREYKEVIEYNLAYNKLDFIVRGGVMSKMTSDNVVLDKNAVANYQQLVGGEYQTEEFPFLQKRKVENELGAFFNENTTTPPNIIFVVCESLSRVFSGPGAKYSGVTPYLDALVDSSLYWRNFVSNCHRTYGVLPNVLGSLPYGSRTRGFSTIKTPYPLHQTLISMLQKQGYSSAFYYPGWGGFDSVTEFMFAQGVAEIYDQKNISISTPSENEWGYSDKQLFEFYLNGLEEKKAPFVDVLLTLSIHSPFDQASQKHLDAAVEYAQTHHENRLSDLDKKVLASAMYFDECMEYLVGELKKTKQYENTILVITGDHNVQNMSLRNEIDRFYVPLYIVSPKLNRFKNIGGVCSHLDIASSLTQLLNINYGVPMPDNVTFVGQGLDTIAAFNAERIFPLEVYHENMAEYLYQDVLLAGNRYYKIGEGLSMELIDHSEVDIQQLKNNYISLDKYVCNQNKLSR